MTMENASERFFNGGTPLQTITPALGALWWAAKGSWDHAHRLVQNEDSDDASWVHAHLHRIEGDLINANYWYWKAGRTASGESLEIERVSIAAELLRCAAVD